MIVKSCKSGRCGTAVLTLLPPAREREAEVSGSVALPGSQPTLNASVQRRFLLCCASASLLIVGRRKNEAGRQKMPIPSKRPEHCSGFSFFKSDQKQAKEEGRGRGILRGLLCG